VNYARVSKKIYARFNALLKLAKTIHHWIPQLIRSTKVFVWLNETKVTGAYDAEEMKCFI